MVTSQPCGHLSADRLGTAVALTACAAGSRAGRPNTPPVNSTAPIASRPHRRRHRHLGRLNSLELLRASLRRQPNSSSGTTST